MPGKLPSDRQQAAGRAQSAADRTGRGKQQASAMQSGADQAALKKH